ncbi:MULTISPECIES: nucleoside-diphosphate sugar epimerase/dehydratase [Hungatella]|uniref:SDR family NAD(P)-dependent oxidoreductase n=1 Tax=Hungatella hathewayi TaxID=154046 RepID=A0AAW9WFL3_9FIRM|nr:MULTISPECIES: nucleoside-diphosphate sugar epimerase/dehydratase [Hungatella]MCQ4832758.1 polysaccharide biosynthesis protein [Hungatella sp. SL.1.14]MUB64009.1 SDR family NAD(P)-dependent oxidoreductase [Hungatella hathewayi]CUQ23986.1 Predicted nucleoside-diphosphate sugar epimerases [Hungatella hathewayi]
MIKTRIIANKWFRSLLFLIYDICMIQICSFLALWIRFDLSAKSIPSQYISAVTSYSVILTVTTVLVFAIFRLYSIMWSSAGIVELESIVAACGVTFILQIIGMKFLNIEVPRSYHILWLLFMTSVVGISRMSYRALRMAGRHLGRKREDAVRIMIVGGGQAGTLLIKELNNSEKAPGIPVCIVDDDRNKNGKYISGVPIRGTREEIPELAEKYRIDEIYIALPTVTGVERKKILEICQQTKCSLKILPGLYQLMSGEVSISKLRDVEIDDLLGREPIKVNLDEIMEYVKDKVVMVTGGGGSIGSELCRQLAGHGVKRLIIFDMYENNAYEIQQELKRNCPELDLVTLIGSVRNTNRLNSVFETYRPDVVYHAAAHKHVPLMEDSPNEAIKNNVIGTYKTARAAMKYGTKHFVLISTDKAVNPTNIMGASKRLCEMVIQMCNSKSSTEFVAVRFGNVLGSNGSVIPLFKKQIENGGPVTVTDPDIIRYFMTIPEAVSLVLQAGAYAKGGEIFVLNMGEPVKILDMAENLIRLSGYEPYKDIDIVFTGLRPGEKMYEELLMAEEGLQGTKNSRIFIGKPIEMDYGKFEQQLSELDEAAWKETSEMRDLVQKIIPEYHFSRTNSN